MIGDPAELGFNADRLARIPQFLKAQYLDTGLMPHAALLVGRGDEIAHLSYQGDARDGVPLGDETIFRIASMSKPITSIAFMQLVERGLVSLSDPVAKFIPEWAGLGVFVAGGGQLPFTSRPCATPMRIVDLLRHTSGLTYSFQERTPVDAAYRKTGIERFDGGDLENFITVLAAIPLEFDPGTRWNYSVATDVVGALIQRISGQTLDVYLQDHILGPLGMANTGFTVGEQAAGRIADCYMVDPAVKMALYDPGGAASAWAKPKPFLSGGGGMVSTMGDYHRFCRMLLNGGGLDGATIIGRKTLEMMVANHLPGGADLTQLSTSMFSEAENAGVGFGLGFATTMRPHEAMVLGSAGDFYWGGMFSTAFFVDPVEDVIMIFMTQLMPSTAYPVRRELKNMIYAALD